MAPYATIHRADLHRILCMAAGSAPNVHLNLDHWLAGYTDDGKVVTPNTVAGQQIEGDALLGADGVEPRAAERRPAACDRAPGLPHHAVPVGAARGAAQHASHRLAGPAPARRAIPGARRRRMNVVAIVHGDPPADAQGWDHRANAADLGARHGRHLRAAARA